MKYIKPSIELIKTEVSILEVTSREIIKNGHGYGDENHNHHFWEDEDEECLRSYSPWEDN